MARRTIRARRASPYLIYLIIAFSLIMVAGWVAFGYMYSLKNRGELIVFGQARVDDPTANIEQLWNQLQDKCKEAVNLQDALQKKQEAAEAYQSEIHRLTDALAGEAFRDQAGDPLRTAVSDVISSAKGVVADATKPEYGPGGAALAARQGDEQHEVRPYVFAVIRSLMTRVDGLAAQVKSDAVAAEQLKTQITGLQAELATNNDKHRQQMADAAARAADEQKRLTTDRDSAVKTTEQVTQDLKNATDQFQVKQKDWLGQRDKLLGDITRLQNDLKALSGVVAQFRRVPTAMSINGRIVKMAMQGQVAYGDLGKKDGILLGLPFSIFAPTELGKAKPEPKAQCRVVKIMNDSCELRIYEIKSDNPVIEGDLLYNPVYDRVRRLHFALIGRMDLENNGQDESEQLRGLITEFGGKVDQALTVQTDFLVVGDRPAVEAAPPAGASPMERQRYEESRKKYVEYAAAIADAENFSIPMMSLNRFIGLMGLAERK